MDKRARILVVDPNWMFQQRLNVLLGSGSEGIQLISAGSVLEARRFFSQDLALIAVAKFVEADVDSLEFVQQARTLGFDGPIIGASGTPGIRQAMITAGCTHVCDKPSLTAKIKEVLGL